ncbi:hypothetical protein RN001_005382 [Aquatica leii]|uniref:DUF4550 domain-containing protein n=1 Tax=Aquatica leii TaxID=1421715 RepID=A0AAN7QKA8_9COLE|nr:hypothetical protein RN001_005382 [Aquatica leii]
MPRRSITVDELIHNLVDYFNQEKQNNGPLIPLTAVHARVSDALKIDTKTISNALRHQNQDENKENEPQRKSLKTKDMDERQKSEIRTTIYNMYINHEHVTLDTLLTKIKERAIHLTDLPQDSAKSGLSEKSKKGKKSNKQKNGESDEGKDANQNGSQKQAKKSKKQKEVKVTPVKEEPVNIQPKHVFQVAQRIHAVHIEYELLPGHPKYQLDVLCWGKIAKIFSFDGDIALKCFVKNDVAWIPVTVKHVINPFSDEYVLKLYEHVIDYNLIETPGKLGKSARADRSKVYYIKEADIDSVEKFTLAYPTDPNINPSEDNILEKEIQNMLWKCVDTPGTEVPEEVVYRLEFLQDPLHKHYINKIIDQVVKKEKVKCKEFTLICPPPETDANLEENENKPKNSKKEKGNKSKKNTKSDKKKKADATESLKISVPGEIFFTDPNLSIYKLKTCSNKIFQAFVITTASDVMTKAQKYKLNPLIIKIGKISNLPVELLRKHKFKEIYAYYSIPYIGQCTTIRRPLDQSITFNEGHAHFLHTVSKLKLTEFMQTQQLVVQIIGERDKESSVSPRLFGSETEDVMISKLVNTSTCTRILQTPLFKPTTITLAVACFNISSLLKPTWDFKEIANCHLPDCMLFRKQKSPEVLEFIDTFTMNEVNLDDFKKYKGCNPLTEETLIEFGTTLSIEVYLNAPLRGVLEIFSQPTVYNRLLFIVNDIKTARFFFHLIMLHNQQILGPETILVNYLKGGVKQNEFVERRVTIDYENLNSVITGFILNNTQSYAFFIEGLMNGLINKIWTQIQDSKTSLMKLFYNSDYLFENRMYQELIRFGGLYLINLSIPLFDILNQELLYLEGNVPTPCWEALKKLDLLFSSRTFEVMHHYNLFPTIKELLSLDMEFGVPHTWVENINSVHLKDCRFKSSETESDYT